MAVIVSSALDVVQGKSANIMFCHWTSSHIPMDLDYIPRRRNSLQKSLGFLC